MSAWIRMHMIVPDAARAWANAQAEALDSDGGTDTFSVPLSGDGLEPATHWGASSLVRPETHDIIVGQLLPVLPAARAYEDPPWSWHSSLEDAGLEPVPLEL